MPEALSTVDGETVSIDQTEAAFAAAMAAPPADKPGMAAPPRRPPEPPANPQAAPHGWTWAEGEWRPKKTSGRPRAAADKPRVTDAPPVPPTAGPGATTAKAKIDRTGVLRETITSLWFVLAAAPVPDQAFGYKLTGVRTRVRAQAALVAENGEGLVSGIATIAKHNTFVGRAVDKLAAGEGGLWVLPAVMMLAPFAAQTAQLWSGKLAAAAELEQLAERVEGDAAAYLSQLVGLAPTPA